MTARGSDAAKAPSLSGSRLRALRPVLRPALLANRHANRIQRSTHNVVTNTRQILNTAAADEHNRVLLQVVADARNVGRNLDPVGQTNARNLAQRRVRLLGRLGVNAGADAAALGRTLLRGAGGLITSGRAALLDELMERRHSNSLNLRHRAVAANSKLWQTKRRGSLGASCNLHTKK